MAKNPVVVS